MKKYARMIFNILKAGLMLLIIASCSSISSRTGTMPNILIIYVDDVGYNDLGCFGAKDSAIQTPNIDKMAAEGIRFTNWISPANTCAPSRASLLTGRYPSRCGVPSGQNPTGTFGEDHVRNAGLQQSEVTIAEMLREHGYMTAMYGKSHLGFVPKFFPKTFGFDEYYGSLGNFPIQGTRPVWDGNKMVHKSFKYQDIHVKLTDHTIDFMKKSKKEEKPFFIYLSHYLAHGPWDPNRHFATDEEWELYKKLPTPGHIIDGGHKLYPALIRELDWHVGKLYKSIHDLGIADNTVVFLVSDNGPWLPAGSAWPLKGSKYNTFEGGHRVPAIAWYPKKIPAAQVSDKLCSTMDIFPTVAHLTGAPLPGDRKIDGKNITRILQGHKSAKGHDVLYYYGGIKLEAVREGNWKLHLPRKVEQKVYWSIGKKLGGILDLDEPLLYNLTEDVAEQHDLASEHPEMVRRLLALAENARAELGDWDRFGSDQKKLLFKGNVNQPERHPIVEGFWFELLRKEGVEILEQ